MFSLCEYSGYLWKSFVYLGKNSKPHPDEEQLESRIGKLGAVVISLVKDLLGHGYNLSIIV